MARIPDDGTWPEISRSSPEFRNGGSTHAYLVARAGQVFRLADGRRRGPLTRAVQRVRRSANRAQAQRPPVGAPDGVAQLLPTSAVTLQVAVLNLDPGRLGPSDTKRTSTSLVFAGIRLDLPLGADVPADDDGVGGS